MLTGEQIRQARNLLLWQPEKLARRARVTTETIHRAESVDGDPPVTIAHLYAIQRAFEAAGVKVTDDEVKLKTESKIAGRHMEKLAHDIEARGVLPTHRPKPAKLHREILGVTYKTAWFLAHPIREAMRLGELAPMGGGGGVVEA